jgi:hypothetical protein
MVSDPAALETLQPLLERLPGAEVAGLTAAPAIQTVARLPVDDELGIELVGAPAAQRFAPVWPLAAHGAMATLFVHSGSPSESVDALRPAFTAVCALPRVRCFHLVLEEKARETSVPALCERLALFDDRSVFALSPERGAEAASRLREILAQLLP